MQLLGAGANGESDRELLGDVVLCEGRDRRVSGGIVG